jgi:hypothetical protein
MPSGEVLEAIADPQTALWGEYFEQNCTADEGDQPRGCEHDPD